MTNQQVNEQHRLVKFTYLLAGDVAIAATVTLAVAPILTVIDQAIVQGSSSSSSYMQSMKSSIRSIVFNPIRYVQSAPFLWMWSTYVVTYSTANILKTITAHERTESSTNEKCGRIASRQSDAPVGLVKWTSARSAFSSSVPMAMAESQPVIALVEPSPIQMPPRSRSHQPDSSATHSKGASNSSVMAVLIGTGVVNCSASLVKDQAYAKLFASGAGNVTGKVPAASYLAWISRDFTGIGASFVLPPILAQRMHSEYHWDLATAQRVAQLAVPVAAQLIVGPLHYLGYDYYNHPNAHHTVRPSRLESLRQNFVPVVAARMARVLPAYGIAGIYNSSLRQEWQTHVESLPPQVTATGTTSSHSDYSPMATGATLASTTWIGTSSVR
jgi:hypothetical protein